MTIPAPTGRLVTIDRRRFYERARSRWLRPVPDGLLRLAAHASATDALLRSNHALAAGAVTVAAIVALRLAATSSASEAESTAKWDAIRATTLLLRSPAADRFGRLCDVALECETRRARAGDIPVKSRERLVEAAGSEFGHASGPIALDLYADVLWFRGRIDSVSDLLADVDTDARELDDRGFAHATEGARPTCATSRSPSAWSHRPAPVEWSQTCSTLSGQRHGDDRRPSRDRRRAGRRLTRPWSSNVSEWHPRRWESAITL